MYVSNEHFQVVVDLLREWRSSGAARLRVAPTELRPTISFVFRDDDPAVVAALDERQLTLRSLREGINDVLDALNAAVAGSTAERFVEVRVDPERFEDGEVEDAQVASSKWQLVHESFDIPEIREREWVKRTADSLLAIDLDWSISVRQFARSADAPTPSGVSYATVKVRAEHPERGDPFSFFPRDTIELSMTVDKEDVAYFIRTLEGLHRELSGHTTGEAA